MYCNLSDEQILNLYKTGDENALDFLLNKYKSLASKIARSYFLVGAESEDILQEAMLGLYSACRTYIDNGSSFKSFATLCITRAVQSAVKKANRLKNKMLNKITNNIIVKHIQNFFIYKFPPFPFILIIQYHTAFYMSIKQFFNIKTSSEKLNAIFNIKICQFTKNG